jgi:hypothetical protein
VDQRVEPPSWLPDGAASSDPKGSDGRDSAADDQGTDGVDSQGPVSFGSASDDLASHDPVSYEAAGDGPAGDDSAGDDSVGEDFGTEGSAAASSVGGPSGQDAATEVNAYSYAGETLHSNGRYAAFGPEGASVSGYGQEGASVSAYGPEGASVSAYSQGSGLAGASGGPSPYPTQFGTPVAEKTGDASRRTTVFPSIPRPKAKSGSAAKATVTRGRRADLVLARLEPWSVMKFSFLISLVAWVMLFVAVAVLYFALSSLGVFDSIQKTLESVTSSSGSPGVSLTKWFSASRILGYTMLIGAINIVLITALSTVGSMIYNLVTHLGGGIEVTLRETD